MCFRRLLLSFFLVRIFMVDYASAQNLPVTLNKVSNQKKIDVVIGGKYFTTFLFPDTLEKPVLYPIHTASGTAVTRGFPLQTQPGDPTDHPHHIGLWLNFENVNGLDFWNNSFAIPPAKKHQYGWIKDTKVTSIKSGATGSLAYQANWTNKQNDVLLQEKTTFQFSGGSNQRIIDRTTVLTAQQQVVFTDAKDGLLGLRLAHQLQIPEMQDKKFTDDKGIVTIVKGGSDSIANGNYVSSEGLVGNDVWSSRAVWTKAYGKIGNDSVSVTIIDHPQNPNYPTYWHARGYGLFAANPLGEKIFTNNKKEKNLQLKPGQSVTFKYRVVINNNNVSQPAAELNKLAADFGRK